MIFGQCVATRRCLLVVAEGQQEIWEGAVNSNHFSVLPPHRLHRNRMLARMCKAAIMLNEMCIYTHNGRQLHAFSFCGKRRHALNGAFTAFAHSSTAIASMTTRGRDNPKEICGKLLHHFSWFS